MDALIDLRLHGIDVPAQRERLELVLQSVLELRKMRGRLTKVTVDDVALVLAMVERAHPQPPRLDHEQLARAFKAHQDAVLANPDVLGHVCGYADASCMFAIAIAYSEVSA